MKPVGRRKSARRLCRICQQRPAKYRRPNGKWSKDAHHDLCTKCHRSAFDRFRAWWLARTDDG